MIWMDKRKLQSPDIKVRAETAKKLGQKKDIKAVALLVSALNDKHIFVLGHVINALGEIGHPDAIIPLSRLFSHNYPGIPGMAREALEKIGQRGDFSDVFFSCLNTKIKDKKLTGREFEWAIPTLAQQSGEIAIEPLLPLLEEESNGPVVGRTIAQIGGDLALKSLVRALDSDNKMTVKNAIFGLGFFKSEANVVKDHLVKLLDRGMNINVISALGELGDKTQAAHMIDMIFSTAPCKMGRWHNWEFRGLFENYCDLIINSASYFESKKILGISDSITKWSYSIPLEPVERLCKIKTPISSNILIKISELRDLDNMPSEESQVHGLSRIKLDFQPRRQLALTELKRRNNPGYDPSVYIDKKAWKFKQASKK